MYPPPGIPERVDRLSPAVASLRTRNPYTNYASLFHVSNPNEPWKSSWSGPRGYGARHYLDDAPFSLWDEAKRDFRHPTDSERDWIASKFPSSHCTFDWPDVFIRTENPPDPLPLTVGCVAATFLPCESTQYDGATDSMPIRPTTNYAAPETARVRDPLPFRLPKWERATEEELSDVVDALCAICNPRRVYIVFPWIIIELWPDDRVYGEGSLPRKVAGFTAVYHHHELEIPESDRLFAGQNAMVPRDVAWDDGNYAEGVGIMYPGLMVEPIEYGSEVGGPVTSTGVLLENSLTGDRDLTIADHGFMLGEEVYHPSRSGRRIGVIKRKTYAATMIAPDRRMGFSVSRHAYFDASPPKELLSLDEVEEGMWSCTDGMSTGAVFLQVRGVMLDIPGRPAFDWLHDYEPGEMPFRKNIMARGFGALSETTNDGLHGAPIVEDRYNKGGVVGLIKSAWGVWTFSAALDHLIDDGWIIARPYYAVVG